MSKRKQPANDEDIAQEEVYRSEPIDDRDSKFIGFFSPTLKPKELQSLAEIKSASHKILGWRRESNQQSINKSTQYVTGSDDDGEKFGGKRIEKVLDATRVSGSCVVARWYGGTMLGPVRFNHMETCAREAIKAWQDAESEKKAKRRKQEEESVEQEELVKSLKERDQNIIVLRTLAREKDSQLRTINGSASASPESNPPNATSLIDYSSFSVQQLRALDKARDATVSFLLKSIDKIEAQMKAAVESATADDEPPAE